MLPVAAFRMKVLIQPTHGSGTLVIITEMQTFQQICDRCGAVPNFPTIFVTFLKNPKKYRNVKEIGKGWRTLEAIKNTI